MSLRVLLVEDDNNDAELLRRHLGLQISGPVETQIVKTEVDMRAALRFPWDAILCDYHLPAFPWPRPYMLAQLEQPNTPFVVVSGVFGDELARAAKAAFTRGVDAYLSKSDLERLGETLDLAMRAARASARRDQAVQDLESVLPDKEAPGGQATHP